MMGVLYEQQKMLHYCTTDFLSICRAAYYVRRLLRKVLTSSAASPSPLYIGRMRQSPQKMFLLSPCATHALNNPLRGWGQAAGTLSMNIVLPAIIYHNPTRSSMLFTSMNHEE